MKANGSFAGKCLVSGTGCILLVGLILTFMLPSFAQDDFVNARENMVKYQIEERGVRNKATLEAMRKVPRHLFVPMDVRPLAYRDMPLPIGFDQTISQPYMVAFMTETIRPEAGMKVLEIGTGSGYQAAILAEIVDSVFSIEIIEPLGKQAEALLSRLGYSNVFVKIGDGFGGWKEHSPYDAILVTAAAEDVPLPLFQQLKERGVMIIPLGSPGKVQTLAKVTKINGKPVKKYLMPVRFVPFTRDD